jgi:hypothetical protein
VSMSCWRIVASLGLLAALDTTGCSPTLVEPEQQRMDASEMN